MTTFVITLLITFVLVVLVISFLAIGRLFSGRSRIVRGECGFDPHRRRDEHCGKDLHCDLCTPSAKAQTTDQKNTI